MKLCNARYGILIHIIICVVHVQANEIQSHYPPSFSGDSASSTHYHVEKIPLYETLNVERPQQENYLSSAGKARALALLAVGSGLGLGFTWALGRFSIIYTMTACCGLDRAFTNAMLSMTSILMGIGLITHDEIAIPARSMAWRIIPISLLYGLLTKDVVQDALIKGGLLGLGQWFKDNRASATGACSVVMVLAAHRLMSPLLKSTESMIGRCCSYLLHLWNPQRYPYVSSQDYKKIAYYMRKEDFSKLHDLFQIHSNIPPKSSAKK